MKSRTLLAVLLAVLLTTPTLLSACSESPVETESSSESKVAVTETETETELEDHLPDKDLAGYGYRIWVGGLQEQYYQTFADEQTGEPINDAVYDKVKAVEERFNVSVSAVKNSIGNYDFESSIQPIRAGEDAYDILQQHDVEMANASLKNMFLNVYTIPYLDPTQPWWPQQTVEALTVKNQMYLMCNNISYYDLAKMRVMFFNKNLMDDIGEAYPYDMVREGTWTLDVMMTLMEKSYRDLNGNGVTDDDDQIGFLSQSDFFGVFETFPELDPYVKDANDDLHYEFNLDKITQLTEKCYDLFFSPATISKGYEDPTEGDTLYANGRALFRYAPIQGAILHYSDADFNYGILPYPKLEEEFGSYHGSCMPRPFAIPTTAYHNRETVGLVTEALNVEGYKKVFPAYYEVALKNRYADQTDDAEMIDLIHSNMLVTFSYLYGNYASASNTLLERLLIFEKIPSADVASWEAARKGTQRMWVEKTLQNFFDENQPTEDELNKAAE